MKFTPEQDALVEWFYCSMPVIELAELMGVQRRQLLNAAQRLGISRWNSGLTMQEQLLELAVDGYENAEVGEPLRKVQCGTDRLRAAGLVFAARVEQYGPRGGRKYRYFDSQEKADAYVASHPPKPKEKPRKAPRSVPERVAPAFRIHAANRPGWGLSDPMHFTPKTKYTVAPKPPETVYRTGTYNTHG